VSDLQNAVGEWAKRTFPGATWESRMMHLCEELGELYDVACLANGDGQGGASAEVGDCVLLLLHEAHARGFDLEPHVRPDLLAAARSTFDRAKERRYEFDPEKGYGKHVSEEQPTQ
jgi:hypothetical protein